MTITAARLHHLALTVRDLDASVEWYGRVFVIRHVLDVPHSGGIGRLLTDEAWQLMVVLHRHDDSTGDTFRETRTGLDHIGLVLPSRRDLLAWQWHLEANGVIRTDVADRPLTQSPIVDESYGSVLVFRDPDNIQLELFVPA